MSLPGGVRTCAPARRTPPTRITARRLYTLAALRRLSFEVAAELYDAHHPPEFVRYAPGVHGASA